MLSHYLRPLPRCRARLSSAASPPYDMVVIGGGPGGYVAAIKGAQLGLRVACVEKRGKLGGTCLNVGCIPSKSLLHSSQLYESTRAYLPSRGILVDNPRVDLGAMMAAKEREVAGLTSGIEYLFKKNKVDYIVGTGSLLAPNRVRVAGAAGTRELSARNIVIATGSDVATLPGIEIDERRVVSSTGALSLPAVPESMVVVGGGVIGLELGCVWMRLGTRVTVVEYSEAIASGADREMATEFRKILERQGMVFRLQTGVERVALRGADGVIVTLKSATRTDAAPPAPLEASVALISVGRRPYTDGLGLDALGVALEGPARIKIDDTFATNVPHVYAIGDVTRGPMLAHKAEEEGIAVAEIIATGHGHVNYGAIPSVIYTHPELAWVGKTEQECAAAGATIKIGRFPFKANSRARTNNETDGLVKVIADADTDRVLGMHILGSAAGEMIAEGVLAVEYGASSEDVARTCHAHPTLSEAVKEAALATHSKAIHF